MMRDTNIVKESLSALVDRLNKKNNSRAELKVLLLRLNSQFPGDVGCFCIYFMNHIILEPGQAMFLAPNLPHAYLDGGKRYRSVVGCPYSLNSGYIQYIKQVYVLIKQIFQSEKNTFKKYKTFSVLIYSYINTSGIGKTRNCVETRRPQGGVFSLNFEFFQFPRVLIKLYINTEKMFYISFII